MFLNPVCLFWPSQLCASSRYCVAADERVKNVLWDFSKRTVFKKTVALWVEHNKHTPGWRSISRLLRQRRLFFSDIRALIFSPCLKWAVNCHGSVTGLWAFFSLLLPFDRIHCETTALLQNDWLQPLLFGNVETARGDPSFAAAQSFDVAVISLRVVRVLRRTKRHHLRPPSPSCDGEFK